ncbi:hypothetical protein KI387_030210, partial [Taxus chinensis]
KDNIEIFKLPKNKLYPEEEENSLASGNSDTISIKNKNNSSIGRSTVRWIQPPSTWHKLNFDGASKGKP